MKKILAIISLFVLTFFCNAQNNTYQLSSHILDLSTGNPAKNVSVTLQKMNKDKLWKIISTNNTDENGRINNLLPSQNNNEGIYKLVFDTHPYFENKNIDSFYPFVEVVFTIKGQEHFHVPITISPFGYSTYRGN
ncbi:hydroxyisourate hydrolase [Chishuiella sp.]|uniref:hydroxyisourate hydrolase n=1 Tax=Chishuiella sp. TaxID=1969467 RepID=UPI0028AC5032|nr:hydroxyisourate hydrolase [Chishuiella sp.]